MRFNLYEWRKQSTYFKRRNLQQIKRIRGIVNTISFFLVWGYAGYYIANKGDRLAKETGLPHSVQVARLTGSTHITKFDLNTGKTEKIGKILLL